MYGLAIMLLAIAGISVRANVYDEPCTPGETKMDGCNTCICVADGSGHACTQMMCGETLARAVVERVCEPGHTKMEKCNNCFCISDGTGYACTRKSCPVASVTCEPGQSFKNYCNTCRCSDDGLRENAICTRKGCAEGVWNQDGTMNIAEERAKEK